MRVLHVIQQMDHGGAERIVMALVRGARDAGADTAVVAADGALLADLGSSRFPIRLVQRRPHRAVGATADVTAALRAFRPDICHVHNPGMAVPVAVATRRGRATPGVVTVHGLPDRDFRRAATLLRWAGLPVVSCGPGVDEALRYAGLRPRRMIVNGIAGAAAPLPRAQLVRELDLPDKATVVVTVGRLAAVKNQRLALRALALLPPHVHLVVVGDGPERGELERFAVASGTLGRVRFTGARADAAVIAASGDLYISPSRSEGMPLALVEAMAAARPVVATAVRGSLQLVEHEHTGLLVTDDDERAMAAAIRRLLDAPDLAARLGDAGRVSVREFTEAAMVAAYLGLYAELM